MAWQAWDALLVSVAGGTTASVTDDSGNDCADAGGGCLRCNSQSSIAMCPASASSETSDSQAYAVSYGDDPDTAVARARAAASGLTPAAVAAVAARRLSAFDVLPDISGKLGEEAQRLLAKTFSVMRVNTLAAEGFVDHHWSTPDRVPHRYAWLWDSCFHTFAMSEVNATLGWEFAQTMLDAQDSSNGYMPGEFDPNTAPTEGNGYWTQPPLLAWAVWMNYELSAGNTPEATRHARLKYALPRLAAYLDWDAANRGDPSGATQLLRWSEGTESGMDNSQRFDHGSAFRAVDFSVFWANDATYVSRIASALGNTSAAAEWSAKAAAVTSDIHEHLWSEAAGAYMDQYFADDSYSSALSVTTFLPLMLPGVESTRVDRLVQLLQNASVFAPAMPLPSEAVSDPTFSTDMWRGSAWSNTNLFAAIGLRRYNHSDLADNVLRQLVAPVQKYYAQWGVDFEFYDAADKVDPTVLQRKGHASGGVRDYHWTAALTFKALTQLAGVTKSADSAAFTPSTE